MQCWDALKIQRRPSVWSWSVGPLHLDLNMVALFLGAALKSHLKGFSCFSGFFINHWNEIAVQKRDMILTGSSAESFARMNILSQKNFKVNGNKRNVRLATATLSPACDVAAHEAFMPVALCLYHVPPATNSCAQAPDLLPRDCYL